MNEKSARTDPDYHLIPLARLYETLGTREGGLSSADARERLARFGPNELKVRADTPEFVKFLRQFRNFFAILLIVGGLLALLAERLDSGQGNLYIAIALFAVVLLNAAFTYLQEYKSERIMESFERMLPSMVEALRDGARVRIPARDLVPGDVMLLFEGDRVPADGRLIEEKRLTVDISSLTGESEPLQLDTQANHAVLLESRNMVFSGALVQSGDALAVVCETGMATQIGRIVKLTKGAEAMETPIHREIAHFVRVISLIAIALGVVFFIASVALGKGTIGSLIFAIGIIVANVPEGLLPTVTLALTMASGRMAEKKALIRNLESVETLGSTTLICTDKTGTLTQNRLGVSSVVFGADAFAPEDRRVADSPLAARAFETMALCNNAALTEAGYSGDPTEGAMLVYVARHGSLADYHGYARLDEEPFSSASRRKSRSAACRARRTAAPI